MEVTGVRELRGDCTELLAFSQRVAHAAILGSGVDKVCHRRADGHSRLAALFLEALIRRRRLVSNFAELSHRRIDLGDVASHLPDGAHYPLHSHERRAHTEHTRRELRQLPVIHADQRTARLKRLVQRLDLVLHGRERLFRGFKVAAPVLCFVISTHLLILIVKRELRRAPLSTVTILAIDGIDLLFKPLGLFAQFAKCVNGRYFLKPRLTLFERRVQRLQVSFALIGLIC